MLQLLCGDLVRDADTRLRPDLPNRQRFVASLQQLADLASAAIR
jgi:hypothetical protein